MKGMKTVWKVGFAVLAATALGFGQANMPSQGGPPQAQPPYAAAPAPPPGAPGAVLPGTVNYVEGPASLDSRPLGPRGPVVMQPGQTLATGNGFAEVLLTPAAFLRLGPNSEFRLITAGLTDTRVQLDRGAAMIEADQFIKGTNLSVALGGATAQIEEKGLYDFDANQQAVKVLDGKATVAEASGNKTIGKGDQLLLASAKPLKKSHFDANVVKAQPLYVWSAARNQDESQANISIAQNIGAYGGWYGPGWYWAPYWSAYAWLPGDGFLYSPFGWGFYSPFYFGYYGGYYRYGHGVWQGHTGVNAHVNAMRGVGGFAGGFHGGGFGGGRR